MTKKNPNFTILQLKSLIIEIGEIQFKRLPLPCLS